MAQHVETVTAQGGAKYSFHPDHRNGNPEKSQWTIQPDAELATFESAMSRSWRDETTAWGLFPLDAPHKLGISAKNATLWPRNLFMAKYVSSDSLTWHGYPADPVRRTSDCPPDDVANMWLKTRLVPKSFIRKSRKRQPCSL